MCMLKTRQIYVDDLGNLQITEADCVCVCVYVRMCVCMYVCVLCTICMYVRMQCMPVCIYALHAITHVLAPRSLRDSPCVQQGCKPHSFTSHTL